MTQRTYKDGPFGVAGHPWLGKADTKYNSDGLFKVDLTVAANEGGEEWADELTKQAEEAREFFFSEKGEGRDIKPKDRDKWELYVPFEREEDDAGNLTGNITFTPKQNAKIKLRDGTVKDVEMAIYDAKGKEMHKDPGPGSTLRVRWATRLIAVKSSKQVGVRMDFCAVQVKDFKPFGQGGGGFGAVDGYEDDGEAQHGRDQDQPAGTPSESDY